MEEIRASKARELFNKGVKIFVRPSEFWRDKGYECNELFFNDWNFDENCKYFSENMFVAKISLEFLTDYKQYISPKKEVVFVEKPVYIYRDRPKKRKKKRAFEVKSLFELV